MVSRQLILSRKVLLWGCAVAYFFLFVTMQMVAVRAMGRTFNSSEVAAMLSLTVDTISQRFVYRWYLLAERSAVGALPLFDFMNNLFVYLPFVSQGANNG